MPAKKQYIQTPRPKEKPGEPIPNAPKPQPYVGYDPDSKAPQPYVPRDTTYVEENREYRQFGSAITLWTCRHREILMSGPAGTGKSRACLEKLFACLLKYPKSRGLIVRKTRESLTDTALVTWEEKVIPENSPILDGASRKLRQSYKIGNGSEVVVGGLDKAGKVMSSEYDIIYCQEAIELYEEDWEALTTRLRNGVMPFQQIIGDTNPDAPSHWLYRRCQRAHLTDPDRKQTTMIECSHRDNPTLWNSKTNEWTEKGKEYVGETLGSLTGVRRPRLLEGKWIQAEGVVYDGWNRDIHLWPPKGSEDYHLPPEWRRYRSIDFGFVHPFSCLWAAVDEDARIYIYREIHRTKQTVKVHSEKIKKLSMQDIRPPAVEPIYEFTVSDHDAEDRATLRENGIFTSPAIKDVRTGIQAVAERLKVAGDGRPRLYVFRNCLVERDPFLDEAKKPCGLIEEFDAYCWPKTKEGKSLKEMPLKEYDDSLDALRYLVQAIDHRVRPQLSQEDRYAQEVAQANEEMERKAAKERELREQSATSWNNVNNPLLWTRFF